MAKLWSLLRSIISGAAGQSASAAARTQALVQGARAYLAQGHADYLRSIVQGNRAQACPHSLSMTLTTATSCYALHVQACMCKKSHFAHGWQLLPYLDGLETCGWLTKGNHSLLVHATHRYVSAMHLRADWVQANLGGSPTRLDWTKAFLRVKEKDRGPLDFDVPGGADTTWQRVYLCLRSGYDTEAIEVLIIPHRKHSPSLLIIWRS